MQLLRHTGFFQDEDDDNTTPSPSPGGGTTPSPSPGGGITDYEDYISNITFDWSTENTIGIINNNSYAPTPTELYEDEVNEETRTLLNRTVPEFNAIMTNPSQSNYSNYCKLKVGIMATHNILSGPLYDTVSGECRNEVSKI